MYSFMNNTNYLFCKNKSNCTGPISSVVMYGSTEKKQEDRRGRDGDGEEGVALLNLAG